MKMSKEKKKQLLLLIFLPIAAYSSYLLGKKFLKGEKNNLLWLSLFKLFVDIPYYFIIIGLIFIEKQYAVGTIMLLIAFLGCRSFKNSFENDLDKQELRTELDKNIKNVEEKLIDKKEKINNLIIDEKFLGTGEVFKFKYPEQYNQVLDKEVIIEYIYNLDKEFYIRAYDLKLRTLKNFKLSKILL